MSSSETATETDAATTEAEAPPRDDRREAQLALITEVLGDAVVGSHIRPGDDLWVRVDREAWTDVHELAKRRLGCTYFSFLSGIDWLPSPFGRDMDSQEDIVTKGVEPKELPPMPPTEPPPCCTPEMPPTPPGVPPEALFSWRVERPGAVLPAGVGWAVTLRGVNACCST